MFDVNWFLAKISGLTINVKRAEKTAYMAVQYRGGKAYNLEGAPVRLPDGTQVPQILAPKGGVNKARYTVKGTQENGTGGGAQECEDKDRRGDRCPANKVQTYKDLGTPYTPE
jgi:hypothetical protein